MFRAVCVRLFTGLLASALICGCSDAKKETEIPEATIPLPTEGPMPAGGDGGKAAPQGEAPAPPNETAQ
jgi:hypothetical protein